MTNEKFKRYRKSSWLERLCAIWNPSVVERGVQNFRLAAKIVYAAAAKAEAEEASA